MTTDKNILFKGIRFLSFALPLLFVGPVIIQSAFRNQHNFLYYPVLLIGILCCAFGMYFIFKGVTTMVKAIFKE